MTTPAAPIAPSAARTRAPLPRWVGPAAIVSVASSSMAGVLWGSVGVAVVVMVVSSGTIVGWSDATLRRVPNSIVGAMFCWAMATVAVADEVGLMYVLIGTAATAAPFLVLHLVNPRWVGFGDVKLLAALGAVLGLLAVSGGLAAMWLAGVLVMVSRSFVPTSWKRNVPFGFWLSVSSTPVAIVLWVAQ